MEQPVFLMVEATPNPEQQEALQTYLGQAPEITRSHGGVPVATYNVEKALDEQEKPSIFAVFSFPARKSIDALFSDPEYQALIPARDLAFNHLRYFVVNEKT
mgnify:CR=1 FL=1